MLTFRRGTAQDAARLFEFARRLFDETFGPTNDRADMDAYMARAFTPEMQERELTDADRICLLGESDGTLAAYALLRVGSHEPCVTGPAPIEIERFYVDFPWHGTGAAQHMMETVQNEARALGAKTIWLGVWEHNPRAIAFYTKLGFTDVGSHDFLLGSDLQTDRVMSMSIE